MDSYTNLAVSSVAAAPSPATSGTTLSVSAGHGVRFPTVPFNATVWPAGVLPDPTTAEIVRVTARSTDALTITRAQESTSARSIQVGDLIAATITKKLLDDLLVSAAAGIVRVGAVGIIIDGAGSAITTGVKGFVEVPFACTITAVTLVSTDAAVTSGSIVIDIWKDSYANYPPTVADTITASAKPTLSSATKSKDATLTGWTTAIAAGDVLGFKVDSVATLTRVTLSLTVQAS